MAKEATKLLAYVLIIMVTPTHNGAVRRRDEHVSIRIGLPRDVSGIILLYGAGADPGILQGGGQGP